MRSMTDGGTRGAELIDDESLETLVPVRDGLRLGRYQLLYELGSGGMATVYLARAEGPGGFAKAVAIKRIHPHLARSRSFIEMFLDEARIAASITHANVCSTFDFGEVDGEYFMAMEYLAGESLSSIARAVARRPDLLASTRWQRIVAKICADVCEGLHAAHELRDERGKLLEVVHRDVTPQNVFVTYDGVAKLVDFGVAFANDRMTRTTTGTLKGKVAYMAPEQLEGGRIDRRVDVWAMGICTWELLCGRRLFRRSTEMQTLIAIESGPIPLPSSFVPSISPSLDTVVQGALDRDPSRRHATARALGRDLLAASGTLGAPVSNGDVVELLAELFEERRPMKLDLVQSVQQQAPPARPDTITAQLPVAPAPLEMEPTHAPARRPHTVTAPMPVAAAPLDMEPTRAPARAPARRPHTVTAQLPVAPAPPEMEPTADVAAAEPVFDGIRVPRREESSQPSPAPRQWSGPVVGLVIGLLGLVGGVLVASPWTDPSVSAVDADVAPTRDEAPEPPRAPSAAEPLLPARALAPDPALASPPLAPAPSPVAEAALVPVQPLAPTPDEAPSPDEALPATLPAPTEEVSASTPPAPPRTDPPRPRPARPAEASPGEIAVTSPVWADIFLRGRPVGRTPTVLELPEGRHRLEFRSGDGRTWTSDVVVRAGERGRLRASPPP